VAPDLAGEDLLDAVVVADRRDRGRLGGEGDRAERRPVVAVAADELRREVGGLRRRTAVAGREQPAAAGQDLGEVARPALEPRRLGVQRGERGGELLQVGVSGRQRAAEARGGAHAGSPIRALRRLCAGQASCRAAAISA
jgi:hypothetical protein